MVLVEAEEIPRRRSDPDEVGAVPRPPQRDRLLREQYVDVDRPIRLAVSALLGLLDEPNDGSEAFGERFLVLHVGACDRSMNDGRHAEKGEKSEGSQTSHA